MPRPDNGGREPRCSNGRAIHSHCRVPSPRPDSQRPLRSPSHLAGSHRWAVQGVAGRAWAEPAPLGSAEPPQVEPPEPAPLIDPAPPRVTRGTSLAGARAAGQRGTRLVGARPFGARAAGRRRVGE